MDRRRRSPARLLAPIALVAFMLAFFAVLVGSDVSEDSGSGGGNGERSGERADTNTDTGTETTTTTDGTEPTSTFYTVKTGDTLAGIAESSGVPVEELQELNPELDPQTLVSGQKIRLKE
jgi:LysM repeat protein